MRIFSGPKANVLREAAISFCSSNLSLYDAQNSTEEKN